MSDTGTILFERNGRVRSMNGAAEDLMVDSDIHVHEDVIVTRTQEAHRHLDDAKRRQDGKSFPIARRGRKALVARVEPAAPMGRAQEADGDDLLFLLLRDPDDLSRPDVAFLRLVHGFTLAEARLAVGLYEGQTVNEYASANQYSDAYVKKLSQRTLSRISARNRADLVRVMARSLV